MPFLSDERKLSIQEWALNVRQGKTYEEPAQQDHGDFERASRKAPSYRTLQAMRGYARNLNRRRYDRLVADYAWLKEIVQEIDMLPEDAHFLL